MTGWSPAVWPNRLSIITTPSTIAPDDRRQGETLEGKLTAILARAGGKAAPNERRFVMERVKGIEPSS